MSGCSQICIDNDGSFECKCRNGYQLQSNAKTCLGKKETFGGEPLLETESPFVNHLSSQLGAFSKERRLDCSKSQSKISLKSVHVPLRL